MQHSPDEKIVCYCINGHEQIAKGRYIPHSCSICNAPIDLNRTFSQPTAEAQVQKETETATVEETVHSAEPMPVQAPEQMPVTAPRRLDANALPVSRPSGMSVPSRIPTMQRDVPDRVVNTVSAPPAPPVVQQVTPQQETSGLVLDYFGEKISIPMQGCWLGRGETGAELFEGNLLISKQHLFVKPAQGDRLQVGPDKSLNGSFIGNNQEKKAVDSHGAEEVPLGSIIWLYNIPLKLERQSK